MYKRQLIIISLLAVPVIKLLSIAVIYKVIAIAAEPVATRNISDSLSAVSYTHLDVYKRQACGRKLHAEKEKIYLVHRPQNAVLEILLYWMNKKKGEKHVI